MSSDQVPFLSEKVFSKDDFLNNIMIYYVTNSITSSMRLYYEHSYDIFVLKGGSDEFSLEMPVQIASFPKDLFKPGPEVSLVFQRVTFLTSFDT